MAKMVTNQMNDRRPGDIHPLAKRDSSKLDRFDSKKLLYLYSIPMKHVVCTVDLAEFHYSELVESSI